MVRRWWPYVVVWSRHCVPLRRKIKLHYWFTMRGSTWVLKKAVTGEYFRARLAISSDKQKIGYLVVCIQKKVVTFLFFSSSTALSICLTSAFKKTSVVMIGKYWHILVRKVARKRRGGRPTTKVMLVTRAMDRQKLWRIQVYTQCILVPLMRGRDIGQPI
jgi:hypothetical protein